MPIVGFICPDSRDQVPFDHFETCTHGVGGRPSFNPTFARIMARKITEDVRHTGLKLTITRVMGCPRQTYIETQYNQYVDPSGMCAAARGTALHGIFAAAADPDYWITEASDPVRLNLKGKLFGVELDMLVDVLRRDLREIVDYKFPLDFSVRYRGTIPKPEWLAASIPDPATRAKIKAGMPKIEYIVQLNAARILLGQQEWAVREGYDPEAPMLTSWDFALGQGGKGGPAALQAPYLTEEEMLGVHPYGGAASIADNIETWMEMLARHAENPPRDEHAASLPLAGQSMMRGDKCTLYCESEPICSGLVRRFGRP